MKISKSSIARPVRFLYRLIRRYFEDGIGKTAAMLAYDLLFSFFPLLLFLTVVLGWLDLDAADVTARLGGVLPDAVVQLAGTFIEHLGDVRAGAGLAAFGLVFSVYFPVRTVTAMLTALRQVSRMPPERAWWKQWAVGAVLTAVMMTAVFLDIAVIVFSTRVLTWLSGVVAISAQFIALWGTLRFVLLGVWLLLAVTLLYRFSTPAEVALGRLLPGAVLTTTAWVLLSAGFSFYVENMGNYSAVYGSIGAVMVLMVWLFLSAAVLLMGAEFNALRWE